MKLITKFSGRLQIIAAGFIWISVNADTVITNNGANLIGEVTVITSETVTMNTEYAGTININIEQMSSLLTDTPKSTRLEDGTVITGITEITDDGFVTVENETANLRSSMDKLMASWIPENNPPKEAGFPQERRWRYSVGADITGKKGNSEENGTSILAEASLISDNDVLKFYTSVDRSEKSGTETSNEIIFGTSYVSYFSDTIGWFISSELERDPFESIDLRASLSAGLSYWLINRPDFSLELQTGLGYRLEAYDDGTNQDTPTLDLRLNNHWQLNSWMDMTNTLIYAPSITEFADYLLVQDSGINMPIGSSHWSLRLGLKNNYKNEPVAGRKKLDTTYYSRLLLKFY